MQIHQNFAVLKFILSILSTFLYKYASFPLKRHNLKTSFEYFEYVYANTPVFLYDVCLPWIEGHLLETILC